MKKQMGFDSSRRTFRGRGGPTDGRIGKNSFKSQRGKQAEPTQEGPVSQQGRRETVSRIGDSISVLETDNGETQERQDSQASALEQNQNESSVPSLENDFEHEMQDLPSSLELQHVKRRIQNVQDSIKSSSSSIVTPSVWEQNVLNAAQNCVKECFSIFVHYSSDELDPEACRETSVALFGLVQLAMQSGPLKGSKPGYFKRCGAEVAKQALKFLTNTLPDEVVERIGFTEMQMDAIKTWKQNAEKATASDKPPSKSALKQRKKAR